MYWDGEKSTYLPAPTNDETGIQSGVPADLLDAKKPKEKDKKEKVKIAKKIAKVSGIMNNIEITTTEMIVDFDVI